jgi:hypothetical protein
VIPRQLLIGVTVMLLAVMGMTFYAWRMRGRVKTENTAISRPVAAPVSGPTEQVTLFVAYDQSSSLRAQSTRIPLPAGRQERAEELLQALLRLYLDRSSPHILASGSEVRTVYLVDGGLAVIDINGAFADGHRSGILVENLTIGSMAETLATNIPGITRVQFLVDGKERDTLAGHADLSTSYDVATINQMASQLQGGG